MVKIIGVRDTNVSETVNLAWRQLPIPIDDQKIMILQLNDICEFCKVNEKLQSWSEESFLKQCSKLSREEILAATMIPSKTLFLRLSQAVRCVGCRRSCERLFDQLRVTGNPSMEPLFVTNNGILTVFMNCSIQSKLLASLFSMHRAPLTEMIESIPKYKKSGRCMLHSMEGVRCRVGSQSWLELWEGMSKECREAVTIISCDKLLITLDNYLRKHRFCHECKNKVHRAYNILVGNISIDVSKEKGYVASLYAGLKKLENHHIHVKSETYFVTHLITRAEPELQGRRERHAKTLEIAQEEVLTCIGLFLYERLQRIFSRIKEEEQAYEILFHVGLDAIRRNFEIAVEEKQGFSKFEKLCEEMQKQELIEKAKKEKRNKKNKSKKRNEESKENSFGNNLGTKWDIIESDPATRKASFDIERSERSWNEGQDPLCSNTTEGHLHNPTYHSSKPLDCSTSLDSIASCIQCSREESYCSVQGLHTSPIESSELVCSKGYCSHSNDLDSSPHDSLIDVTQRDGSLYEDSLHSQTVTKQCLSYGPSLQEMLDDFSCDTDEIPEAEVKAWHARLGAVNQKRAELRQTLQRRFQQLCHRKTLFSLNGIDVENGSNINTNFRCQKFAGGLASNK